MRLALPGAFALSHIRLPLIVNGEFCNLNDECSDRWIRFPMVGTNCFSTLDKTVTHPKKTLMIFVTFMAIFRHIRTGV